MSTISKQQQSNSNTRALLLGMVALFLISRAVYVYFSITAPTLQGPLSLSDVPLYHHYYQQFQLAGEQGKSFFSENSFEYPPLMLAFVLTPGMIASLAGSDLFETYNLFFHLQMMLLDLFVFLLLPLVIRVVVPTISTAQLAWRQAFYIVLPLLCPYILYNKLDLAVAATTIAALALAARRAFIPAAFILGLAAALKLSPIVLAPPLLIWVWTQTDAKGHPYRMRAAIAGLMGILAGFLPFWIAAGQDAFSFIAYQTQRGLQLESIPASLGILQYLLGGTLKLYEEALAVSVSFPGSAILAQLWTVLLITASLSFLWLLWQKREMLWHKENGFGMALIGATLLLLILIIGSKIFSAQFLSWLTPLVLVLPYNRHSIVWTVLCMGALLAFTHQVYPNHYLDLVQMKPVGIGWLFARNALLPILFMFLWQQWKKQSTF